ncbi:hypothetical protein JCM21900_006710 [Sporobolomyces salmonicolor]
MDRPTPRVNSARLAEYTNGKIVRLIGKVINLDGETAILEAADGGQVTVRLSKVSNLADTYVEVVGKVDSDLVMTELATQNLGDSIDMDLANKVVELTHLHPDVFPTGD